MENTNFLGKQKSPTEIRWARLKCPDVYIFSGEQALLGRQAAQAIRGFSPMTPILRFLRNPSWADAQSPAARRENERRRQQKNQPTAASLLRYRYGLAWGLFQIPAAVDCPALLFERGLPDGQILYGWGFGIDPPGTVPVDAALCGSGCR